jgi:CBS domain containing-hemolysin-like protein
MAGLVFIYLIIFSSLFGITYVWMSTRNKERMALIEKGADASLFATKKRNFTNLTLKIGMLAAGIGIGILAGALLHHYTLLIQPVAYFSMIFIFGGLFLIINALIERGEKFKED